MTIYIIQYTGSKVLYNTGLFTLYSIQGTQFYTIQDYIHYTECRVYSPIQYRTIYTIQYTGFTVLYNTGLYALYSIQGTQS